MNVEGISIDIGLNVFLLFAGGPEASDAWTWAVVSLLTFGVPEVRFAPREYGFLAEAASDAWRLLVVNPDSPLKMKGVNGQEGWREHLMTMYGSGFAFVVDAWIRGDEMPLGSAREHITERLKALGLDADMF